MVALTFPTDEPITASAKMMTAMLKASSREFSGVTRYGAGVNCANTQCNARMYWSNTSASSIPATISQLFMPSDTLDLPTAYQQQHNTWADAKMPRIVRSKAETNTAKFDAPA